MADIGETTVSIQTRCPNMRQHINPVDVGGRLIGVPCKDCYSVTVTSTRIPWRESVPWKVVE
jgi:hypothetical protein